MRVGDQVRLTRTVGDRRAGTEGRLTEVFDLEANPRIIWPFSVEFDDGTVECYHAYEIERINVSTFKIGDEVTLTKLRYSNGNEDQIQPGQRAVVIEGPDFEGDYDLKYTDPDGDESVQFAHESTIVAWTPEFKVGDRVRVTDGQAARREYYASVDTGDTGVVVRINPNPHSSCPIEVHFDDIDDSWMLHSRHLEPVSGTVVAPKPDRIVFEGGGMRDVQDGKPRFDLLMPASVPFSEQFLTRCAEHMAKGAEKYEDRNWEQFSDPEARDRAKASAMRHMIQWQAGETDEDHAAAVFFNLMAAEYVQGRIDGRF